MGDVWDMECSRCETFMMWDVWDVGFSGCRILKMQNDRNVRSLVCGIFAML